jgi:hypothetical protein
MLRVPSSDPSLGVFGFVLNDAFCVTANYASRLTNIKDKTPGDAGRFLWSVLCSCEEVLRSQSLPDF